MVLAKHILKVQRPMASNRPGQQHFFYDEDHKIEFLREATAAEKAALGQDWKMYAEYQANRHGALTFTKRVDAQDW